MSRVRRRLRSDASCGGLVGRGHVLGDHFDQFIAGQVDSGRYGSASEVVRAGLRLLETNGSKLDVLRNALVAGEKSGRAKYSYESLIAELDAESK